MKIPGLKNTNYIPGIVRIPKESKARKRQIGFMRKIKNRIMHFLFSSEGVLTNLLIVIVHLALLISVPILLLLALTWCLLQIENINEEIYEVTHNLFDVFNPSTYNFWLLGLSGKTIWFVLAGMCGFFLLSGLIELISFYATGPRDTGKYIVEKSF
jgi:hypothetical protein